MSRVRDPDHELVVKIITASMDDLITR
ncbi:hypothetical protein SAL_2314, partial [Streptococcus agalactiae 515]